MKFILELEPGATYATLARRLRDISERLTGVNMKSEHGEEINIRECGEIVARYRIEK
jgi:hypothetical protein